MHFNFHYKEETILLHTIFMYIIIQMHIQNQATHQPLDFHSGILQYVNYLWGKKEL